jgi:hypothetical protein
VKIRTFEVSSVRGPDGPPLEETAAEVAVINGRTALEELGLLPRWKSRVSPPTQMISGGTSWTGVLARSGAVNKGG